MLYFHNIPILILTGILLGQPVPAVAVTPVEAGALVDAALKGDAGALE